MATHQGLVSCGQNGSHKYFLNSDRHSRYSPKFAPHFLKWQPCHFTVTVTVTKLPKGTFPVSIDIVGLYNNIPNEEGLESLRKALNTRLDQKVPTNFIYCVKINIFSNIYFYLIQKNHQKLVRENWLLLRTLSIKYCNGHLGCCVNVPTLLLMFFNNMLFIKFLIQSQYLE